MKGLALVIGVWLSVVAFAAGQTRGQHATAASLGEVRLADRFPGADMGAQINAAYADLPPTGGRIRVPPLAPGRCYSYSTPIDLSADGRPAVIEGDPGGSTCLNWMASAGTAIILNYGTHHQMGPGLRDLTLTGPGHASKTVGVVVGGSHGAEGSTLLNVKVQSFGTNLQFGANTWIVNVDHSMFRDGQTNVFVPAGLGLENMQFSHSAFADAPPPFSDSVLIQSQGDFSFFNCSFDNAQLSVKGNAIVALVGGHFENPNRGPAYDFIDFYGNTLMLNAVNFLQVKNTDGPRQLIAAGTGTVFINAVEMFSGSRLTNFALLSGKVNVYAYGFIDNGGNISGPWLGGTTTGRVIQVPNGTSRNVVIGSPGPGQAALDVTGDIRATDGRLISTVATGAPPLVVGSTTPVTNLTTVPAAYDALGAQQLNAHLVRFSANLAGGSASVLLRGAAVFASATSYTCTANDATADHPVRVSNLSGSQFALTGAGADTVAGICLGN